MEAIARFAKTEIRLTDIIPFLIIIFSFAILSNEANAGLCYNKAVFDGVVFLLCGIAMIRDRQWCTALVLIFFCCGGAYLFYLFPTRVSDFDIPSIIEVAAFILFSISFYLKEHRRFFGVALFIAAALIFLLSLFEVQNPLLLSYSPIIAFLFSNLGIWLCVKPGPVNPNEL